MTSSASSMQQEPTMDAFFHGMPEKTVRLALQMAQLLEGRTEQDLEAMIAKYDKSKYSNNSDPIAGSSSVEHDKSVSKQDNNLAGNEPGKDGDNISETLDTNYVSNGLKQGNHDNIENISIKQDNKNDAEQACLVEGDSDRLEGGIVVNQSIAIANRSPAAIADDINDKAIHQILKVKGVDDVNDVDDNYTASSDNDFSVTTTSGMQFSGSEMSGSPSERLHVTQDTQAGTYVHDNMTTKNISEYFAASNESHEPRHQSHSASAASAENRIKDLLNYCQKTRDPSRNLDEQQTPNIDNISESDHVLSSSHVIPTADSSTDLGNSASSEEISAETSQVIIENHKPHPTIPEDNVQQPINNIDKLKSTANISKLTRMITLDPESHRVNYRSSVSPVKNEIPSFPSFSSKLDHKDNELPRQPSQNNGSSSSRLEVLETQEHYPSLPAEIKDITLDNSLKSHTTFNSKTPRTAESIQDTPPIVSSLSKSMSTFHPQKDISNAIMSANMSLPSIPLYYQPHIVMKDNLPVLMLKPVWTPNVSSESNQSVDLLSSASMVLPLVNPDASSTQDSYVTTVCNNMKTNSKDTRVQLHEGTKEPDLKKKSEEENWPTWTDVSEERAVEAQLTNPFLDSGDSVSYSSSCTSPRMPGSNFGFTVPSSVYQTSPSSNPFKPVKSHSDSNKEGLSRTDFKTIPKSMLASQVHLRETRIGQSTGSFDSRQPLMNQVSSDYMSQRQHSIVEQTIGFKPASGPPLSPKNYTSIPSHRSTVSSNFAPQGINVSHQRYDIDTPWDPPRNPSGNVHGDIIQSNAIRPKHSLENQLSNINCSLQPRLHLPSDSMVTLLKVSDDSMQSLGQVKSEERQTTPSMQSTGSNFTITHMLSSSGHSADAVTAVPGVSNVANLMQSSLPSTGSKYTTTHMAPSSGHSIDAITADPSVNTIINAQGIGEESKPETRPKMPGHVAPYWVPDDEVFCCAYCHLKFTFLRRRHHCRGCGKIFCNDCCSQLARLSYLQYQIGRICINCTNVIKDYKKQKKTVKPKTPMKTDSHPNYQVPSLSHQTQTQPEVTSRNPPQSPYYNPTCSSTNQNLQSSPNKTQVLSYPGYSPSSGDEFAAQSSPPIQPLNMVYNHAVAMETSPNKFGEPVTSQPISQSDTSPFKTVQISHGHSTQSHLPSEKQDRERTYYSEFKVPLRPAGKFVSWTEKSFAGRLLAQDKRKALAKDLKDLPHGVTMQLADELNLIVRKVKVQSSPLVQAWCCHSVGLKAFNQQEIAMHFKVKPKEDVVPEEILRMYKVILELVKLGNLFYHSNFLAFKSPFLGTSDNAALIFTSCSLVRQPKAFGEPKPERLYAILVKRSEFEYAQYIPTRFLLRLGQEFKSFPFPILNFRDRAPVYDGVDPDDIIYKTSVELNRHLKNSVPEALIPGLTVLHEDSKVVLQIPAESQALIIDFFDRLVVKTNQIATIPLASDISTNVDQYRVYHQSIHTNEISLRKRMSLFRNPLNPTHHGVSSVTGLGYILLCLNPSESPVLDQRGKLVDDGVIVHLTDLHTKRLTQCLRDRSNCRFFLGDQFEVMYFELRWIQEPLSRQMSKEFRPQSLSQEAQKKVNSGKATIDVRHSAQSSELKKLADARLGDVLILARLLEDRIKQASTEPLMKQAKNMKAGETKELVLKLALRNGITKWSIGPANQPMSLIRSLQMALYDVKLTDFKDAYLDLTFNVTIINGFDMIAKQHRKDWS